MMISSMRSSGFVSLNLEGHGHLHGSVPYRPAGVPHALSELG
jgi:hypothetical protein